MSVVSCSPTDGIIMPADERRRSFNLEWAEMEARHSLNFAAHEEGRVTFKEYLDRVVFFKKRSFSRAQFRIFMFAQSKPYTEMLDLVRNLKAHYGLRDRRGQQRIASSECSSDSQVQAGRVRGYFHFILLRPRPQARRGNVSTRARHRPGASQPRTVYRKHADVRPDRGRPGDSKHCSHGLQVHLRETRFVRIAERQKREQ